MAGDSAAAGRPILARLGLRRWFEKESRDMTSDSNDILVTRDGSVLTVTFNRPRRLNAFTYEGFVTTAEAIDAAGADESVRAIVLTGAGNAFSAGADLGEPGGEPTEVTVDAANEVTRAIRRAPKPVLAAVNGAAVSIGCSFALASDVVIARESAYFLLSFSDIGLMPDGGATALFPATVGRMRAMGLALLPRRVPAPVARDWGMITDLVADDDFDAAITQIAGRLAAGPTKAYAQTKRAINAGSLAMLPQALEFERDGQQALFATKDYLEGVHAFRERRTAQFTGR
jgi:enoyl-CoA hydratase/carnithine racemase